MIGQRTVALCGPGLLCHGGILQALEGLPVESLVLQALAERAQGLLGLRQIAALHFGIQAEEAAGTVHAALAPGSVGQAAVNA
ncbi:hypothetical protein FQZ97_785390 [compost metagenome]